MFEASPNNKPGIDPEDMSILESVKAQNDSSYELERGGPHLVVEKDILAQKQESASLPSELLAGQVLHPVSDPSVVQENELPPHWSPGKHEHAKPRKNLQ